MGSGRGRPRQAKGRRRVWAKHRGPRARPALAWRHDRADARPQPPLHQIAIADRFAGRHALVTGAGSGIGTATARQLVAEGAHVTGVDPDAEGLEETTRALGAEADRFHPLIADIADAAAQDEMIAAACGPDGELDVLVNNAAVSCSPGSRRPMSSGGGPPRST
ncbi:MAG: SDR family NAD(P)-dependent oxidoreductase [Solirubrobacterales bacterium]